jgi:hypothetical protein
LLRISMDAWPRVPTTTERKVDSITPTWLLTGLSCTELNARIQIIILLFFFFPLRISLLQDLPTPDLY